MSLPSRARAIWRISLIQIAIPPVLGAILEREPVDRMDPLSDL